MNHPALIALALIGAAAALPAAAEDVGQHPAVFAPRSLPAVNPNTFLVGHPASPRNRAGHANHEHPAVTRWAGQAAQPSLDTNTYLVQPPAAVRWTLGPATDTVLAAGTARPANTAPGAQ